MEKVKTIGATVAAIAVISFFLIWGNTWYRQWSQYEKGMKAVAAGDAIAAIAGFESAIHMYTPVSPLVERSAEQLWKLAEGFERTGDVERALIAYRSLRSSFYATRGLYQPGKEWILRCDAKIPPLATIMQARQRM